MLNPAHLTQVSTVAPVMPSQMPEGNWTYPLLPSRYSAFPRVSDALAGAAERADVAVATGVGSGVAGGIRAGSGSCAEAETVGA